METVDAEGLEGARRGSGSGEAGSAGEEGSNGGELHFGFGC